MTSAAIKPIATRRCSRHSLRGWTRKESAERTLLSTPALRIGVGDAGDLAERRQVVEARQDDLQDEGGGRGTEVVFADDRFDDLEGGRFGVDVGEVRADFVEQLVRLAADLGDLRRRFAERFAVAGQAEVDVERLDPVEARP